MELRLGRPDSAFPHALEGEQIGREHSRLTLGYLSEREALEYIAARPRGLDLALAAAHDAADRGAVYNELIRGRALALDELASRRHAASDSSDPDIAALWEKLRSARQRFANLIVRQPDESRADAYSALIDEAGRNKETAERALAERSTTFRATETAAQIGLSEVRQALPEDAALVSFIRYDAPSPSASPNLRLSGRSPLPTMSLYAAFVLRPGDREPVIVVLGSAPQIDRQIAAWRQALLTGASTPATDLPEKERALRVVGASLRRRIWDPVASQVSGAKRVFVVPDSTINLIPFAALPAPTGGYLIESGPIIHYLTAERDIAARAGDRRDDGRGLLAIGGPSFSDPTSFSGLRPESRRPQRCIEASPRIDSPASRAPVDIGTLPPQDARSPCVTLQNMKFDPLPAAAREAAEVVTLWRRSRAGNGIDRKSRRHRRDGECRQSAGSPSRRSPCRDTRVFPGRHLCACGQRVLAQLAA